MEKNNHDLETLLSQSLRLEAVRVPRTASNAKTYVRVRSHARILYNVLKRVLTLPCGCSVPHNANLKLETRSSNSHHGSDNEILYFHVVFYFDTSATPQTVPWNWREAIIEPINMIELSSAVDRKDIIDDTTQIPKKVLSTAQVIATTSSFLTAFGGSYGSQNSRKPVRKVSFETSQSSSQSITPEPSISSNYKPLSTQPTIEDLCKAIYQVKEGASCLGVLVDESNKQHRVTMPKSASIITPEAENISLKTLLSETTKLNRRDRLILGLKLASTLLQLYSTPWLRESWSKSDILFLKSKGDLSDTPITTPFVSKAFAPPTCVSQARTLTNPPVKPLPQVRNQSLFALGILLIELWYGKPLEDLRVSMDMGEHDQANEVTDFATARRLLDDIYADAGEWYGDAVRRCIYCEFDQRHSSLDAESLREAVHRGVVTPLRENLTAFSGGRLEGVL